MANEKQLDLIDRKALKSCFCKCCNILNPDEPCEPPDCNVMALLDEPPTVNAIPIAVMKRAISGINAADQCDQAGRYDFELRNALKTVLRWYDSPVYKECERRTKL